MRAVMRTAARQLKTGHEKSRKNRDFFFGPVFVNFVIAFIVVLAKIAVDWYLLTVLYHFCKIFYVA